MKATPIGDFLTSFASLDGAHAAKIDIGVEAFAALVPGSGEPEAIMAAKLETAHASGVQQGEARAAAAFGQALDTERAGFEARMAAERASWVHSEGQRLMQSLHEAVDALEIRLAEQVCRILESFIPAQVRADVLAALRENLTILLRAENARVLQVRGPADLLDAMRETLPSTSKSIEFVEADDPDVSIIADDTTISSQLRVWEERLGDVGP